MKKFFIVELTIKQGEHANLLKYLNQYAVDVRREDGCECLDILIDPQSDNTVIL
jgi:quinol monooxygenase YgiN